MIAVPSRITELLDKLQYKWYYDGNPGYEVNYYKMKRMVKSTGSFARTEPHAKYKCRYKHRCVWHSKC